MTTLRQAAELALEAMKDFDYDKRLAAIESLEKALAEPECKTHPDAPHGFCRNASASEDRYVCECEYWEPEPEPEPVAWQWCRSGHFRKKIPKTAYPEDWRPLYTAPPQKQWVELTDENISSIFEQFDWKEIEIAGDYLDLPTFAKAIEAKLKEKNT